MRTAAQFINIKLTGFVTFLRNSYLLFFVYLFSGILHAAEICNCIRVLKAYIIWPCMS